MISPVNLAAATGTLLEWLLGFPDVQALPVTVHPVTTAIPNPRVVCGSRG